MFKVDSGGLIGRPENPPAFPVEHRFEVGGETLEIADVPVQAAANGQPARRLAVIPPVALRYLSDVRLFAPGAERPVMVEVTALRDGAAGTLELTRRGRLESRARVAAIPACLGRRKREAGVHRHCPDPTGYGRHHGCGSRGRGDVEQRAGRDPVRAYPHTVASAARAAQGRGPRPCDQGPARRLHSRRRRPGGRGLEEMGYDVTRLAGEDLTPEKLSGLDSRGDRRSCVQRAERPRRPHWLRSSTFALGGRDGRRAVQPAERAQDKPARPVRPAALRLPCDRRERAGRRSSRPTTRF